MELILFNIRRIITKLFRKRNVHLVFNYDDCFKTASGLKFNIFNPREDQVCLTDISLGLSNNGRFTGQSNHFFSIAQHCLLVVDLLPNNIIVNNPGIEIMALMHDAAEAYIKDMIKPLKIYFPVFKKIEEKIMKVIASKFDLNLELMPIIKKYDKQSQLIEYKLFYENSNDRNIRYLTPEESHYQFIKKFHELSDRRTKKTC
jgi:uncharacterized protein